MGTVTGDAVKASNDADTGQELLDCNRRLAEVREQIAAVPAQPAPGLGWTLFGLGVFVYVFGRVFGIVTTGFNIGGTIGPMIVGALILLALAAGASLVVWRRNRR